MNKIEEILADIQQGKMVILMDDEDRENEGDLIMAASCITPQDINFMARYGRGLICLTLTKERCEQLRLPLMVQGNGSQFGTNFTVSIEAAEGVTTGISAADRARTIQAAVHASAKPEDLSQPGHIFPLMAQPGGVLSRAGHTEAGCDLARLAGLEPSAVIVEILNEDGSMARKPDLEKFAQAHDLKMGTIADLIEYRLYNEQTVERVADNTLVTDYGEFQCVAFLEATTKQIHLALVKGSIKPEEPTLVRVHVEDKLTDLVGLRKSPNSWPLSRAMMRVAEEGVGVIVILSYPQTASQLLQQIAEGSLSMPAAEENWSNLRTIGAGSQILSALGVKKLKVMSAPKKVHALSGFGLEVIEYVPF